MIGRVRVINGAENEGRSYLQALILASFAIVVWGGTPIATKVAVEAVLPLAVTVWRTLLAAMIAGALAVLWRPTRPRSRRALLCTILSAGMGYIAFPWLLALGLRHASASIAALLIALAPVFTGVLTLVLGRIKVNDFWIVGTSLAVVGSTVLLGFDAVEVGRDRLLGNFIVLLAVLAAATGYVSGAEAAREDRRPGRGNLGPFGRRSASLDLLETGPRLIDERRVRPCRLDRARLFGGTLFAWRLYCLVWRTCPPTGHFSDPVSSRRHRGSAGRHLSGGTFGSGYGGGGGLDPLGRRRHAARRSAR